MTIPLIDILLAFALMVVVPLSIRLHGWGRRQVAAAAIAGGLSSLSFLFPEGFAAALLASASVLVPSFLLVGFRDGSRLRSIRGLAGAIPVAYLLVGTSWLAMSRYGARPLGFSTAIVELTAVHFHYAGFVAPTIVEQLVKWLRAKDSRFRSLSSVSYWAVLLATPVTAMGITFSSALGAVGALMFSGGLVTASAITLREVTRNVPARAAVALTVSALSVAAAMLLALAYAFGHWLGTPAPSLEAMVWTHGVLNAVGFAFGGVVGWLSTNS
jgi:hypothetical protein